MSCDSEITNEEFAQYDRQIRLWGLDAQKRLRQSKILVAGVGGFGSEVVKNIVLSGVFSVTLLDERKVCEEDFCSQLLITTNHVGMNIAEASKVRTQELNPNVEVYVDTESLDSKTADYFAKFDIVCVTRCTLQQRLDINNMCRKKNVKFFSGDVFGFYGYCFLDLGEHEYVEEVTVNKQVAISVEDGSAEEKTKSSETVSIKKTATFCSYETALKEDWKLRNRRSLRQSSSVFYILQILDEFQSRHQRLPIQNSMDSLTLSLIRKEILTKAGMKENFVSDDFQDFCCSVLSPVAAVVGGVMAQEVIKACSKKNKPHQNFFFFNGLNHTGIVDNICPK
nr:SUMO-activating enzyme subunit 1 [Ciona intestinalis]|eukprot:XP_002121043.1 SUMO-activating enzyme subunit 1 [Ciona intestinalis]